MNSGCCCDGIHTRSVTEHIDKRTVHLNRSFLLLIENHIIIVSVKKKKADLDFWMCLSEILWTVIQQKKDLDL